MSQTAPLTYWSCWLATFILIFSLTIGLINHQFYHYQGVNYFPLPATLIAFITLGLIRIGLALLIKPQQIKHLQMVDRLCLVFGIICLIALLTEYVQLTPFSPIDKHILFFDSFLKHDTKALLEFIHQTPSLFSLLQHAYNLLDAEIVFSLLLVVISNDAISRSQFIFLLLSSAFIGFCFYYFFPTNAPASVIESSLFLPEQRSTFLKFYEIHHHIPVSTYAGGLIALPSFHCIWAILCQYYLFHWRYLGWLILPLNVTIVASCVVLGWHYLIDALASIGLCAVLIKTARHLNQKQLSIQ